MPTAFAYVLIVFSVVGLILVIAALRLADRNGTSADMRLIVPVTLVAVAAGVVGFIGAFS